MNTVADGARTVEPEVTGIAAALVQWYANHSSIRRLWAVEHLTLIVFVVLEPTSDGDDTLPVWLANNAAWANDLRLLAGREVQLQLLVAGDSEDAYVKPGAVTIAEVSWRDSWMT